MNLLGAALYDPTGGAAVSKVTTSLLAMTALDTTNLRIAFTIPAHGMVLVKMACVHHGSTTTAQVLLGVLEGSTLRGRAATSPNLLGTAVATTRTKLECSYVVTGLTPGAVNWDAAYGVEIVSSAGGAIKYGGPNNTTTDDGFGAFQFEVWDPRPLPTAAPGVANGVLISGSNAGTTTLGALTVTGTTTMSDGLAVSRSTANSSAIAATGSGSGHGILAIGGNASGAAAAGNGVLFFGGTASTTGGGTAGRGMFTVGGTAAASTNGAGDGFASLGGTDASAVGGGKGFIFQGTTNAPGLVGAGGPTGNGASFLGGATSGDGLSCSAQGLGHGISTTAVGSSKHGILATGGTAGTSDGIKATAGTGGVDIRGNITGNLTGTINGLTATALADFFDTDSGTTYAGANAGSVVKQIADNAGGSSLTEAGIAAAVWDRDATGHQTQGTFGQAIGDPGADTDTIWALANTNLNATMSSRASQASVDTIDDFLDTEIAAIKAKTDNLPVDPADASDIAASFTTVNTKLDTIDDFLDTEIAAIKASTDNLPSDPADASVIAGLISGLDTKLDTIDNFLDTEIAAIKAKTDSLTFTVAGVVDSNIQVVNDVTVDGTGTTLDPWGPV